MLVIVMVLTDGGECVLVGVGGGGCLKHAGLVCVAVCGLICGFHELRRFRSGVRIRRNRETGVYLLSEEVCGEWVDSKTRAVEHGAVLHYRCVPRETGVSCQHEGLCGTNPDCYHYHILATAATSECSAKAPAILCEAPGVSVPCSGTPTAARHAVVHNFRIQVGGEGIAFDCLSKTTWVMCEGNNQQNDTAGHTPVSQDLL